MKKRIAWNNETLRQDYGKDYIGSVPKYDGFCTVPDTHRLPPVVGKFLNLYEPIDHRPQEGDFSHIQSLVRHIFGSSTSWAWTICNCSTCNPCRKLPILLLVSEERNTGKSTFLNFLKALFQNNVTFNTNEDFRSQFNSDWAGKLLIVVDEVLLNRREDSERLKNLSTTLSYKVEAKGKDRDEIAFFAKFVLCSNNEYLPVIIDAGETRYWVRKIDRLQSDDTDFLQKLKAEIPAFLSFPATQRTFHRKGKPYVVCPIIAAYRSLAEDYPQQPQPIGDRDANLSLTSWKVSARIHSRSAYNDILLLLVHSQVKVEKHQVRKVLQECWKLTPAPNGLTYTTYQFNYNRECRYEPIRRVGRFYTVTRNNLNPCNTIFFC